LMSAISCRLRLPSSGRLAMSIALVCGPTPALSARRTCLLQGLIPNSIWPDL
jgi:hypothetical protein